jgi:hypothetical protein
VRFRGMQRDCYSILRIRAMSYLDLFVNDFRKLTAFVSAISLDTMTKKKVSSLSR